jgi:RND superfamily putative drug exporter
MRAGAPKPEPEPEPNEPTTAIPVQRPPQPDESEATTKIPIQQDAGNDSASTEKLNTPEEQKRHGGGMSAAELLRREGRM